MVSKSNVDGDLVRIGSFHYMKDSVAHSLYRNGKVLARRDKDGSDAGKEGMDLEARSMPVRDARRCELTSRRTLDQNGFEMLAHPLEAMDLDFLNNEQFNAVTETEGSLLILYVACSGKTRVLTYRIAHLIKQGIDPFSILALTFTNKAAKEMKTRIEGLAGTEARSLWMGNFNCILDRILITEGEKIGYPPIFVIFIIPPR